MPTDFQSATTRLFPGQASGRLARALGVSQRVAQRWLGASREAPGDVTAWVDAQDGLLRGSGLPERIRDAASSALSSGLHPEIVGAHLSALYREVTGREVE